MGDLDQQLAGDGRWKIEWYPVQCPVGSSTFKYGYQGGNPWYRKIQAANGRVPVASMEVMEGGAWKKLTPTIDNFHEFHGNAAQVRAAAPLLVCLLSELLPWFW